MICQLENVTNNNCLPPSLLLSLPNIEPSGYPTMVLATPINTTAINVTWMPIPLDEQNGIIVKYLVGCPLCPLTQYSTSELYYVVNGLRPNSNYWFVLAAENGKGFGPDSLPVSATTIGKSKLFIFIHLCLCFGFPPCKNSKGTAYKHTWSDSFELCNLCFKSHSFD